VGGTLGVPMPRVEVAILPPTDYTSEESVRSSSSRTTPVPDGEPGEICVRGANVFAGYLHDDGAGLPRRGDWLCTGDMGARNADGTFSFLRRLKPMFTRNGFNVYPFELERAVRELPGVTRAEVVPIPEPAKENDILLRVAGTVTVEEVKRWCETRLSAYKQPSVVEMVND
jgi:acyl-CoA synthetase (AMP-forming)/AMP-acid ligase II